MTQPAQQLRAAPSAEPAGHPAQLFARAFQKTLGATGLHVIRVPAPVADPFLPLSVFEDGSAFAWAAPDQGAVSGVGEALRIDVRGPDRFARMRARAQAALADAVVIGGGPPPRLYGGFAFAEGAADDAPWAGFEDASLFMPRWQYELGPRGATLSFAFFPENAPLDEESRAIEELDRLLMHLAYPATEVPLPLVRRVTHEDRESVEAQVAAIVDAIGEGRFEKVVAARRSVVELEGHLDPATLLRRLSRRFRGCTTFAFRRDGVTFVGATPERLLSLRGRSVHTEALAGTASTHAPDAAELLRASDKDAREHALVVHEIEQRLKAVCRAVSRPAAPTIRRLPNVLHLCTPIVGELPDDALHVLDVAALLHPTPAVGGVPREEAIDWIIAAESAPRGWYSGPVGWVDANGDGDLWVALRSGLLESDRAYLFAGGGIVRDSEPAAEYDEAAVKLSALLGALTGGAVS